MDEPLDIFSFININTFLFPQLFKALDSGWQKSFRFLHHCSPSLAVFHSRSMCLDLLYTITAEKASYTRSFFESSLRRCAEGLTSSPKQHDLIPNEQPYNHKSLVYGNAVDIGL